MAKQPKQIKPRTWWTVFDPRGNPLPWYCSAMKLRAIAEFVKCSREAYPSRDWDVWLRQGYTVGKISVSPFVPKQKG